MTHVANGQQSQCHEGNSPSCCCSLSDRKVALSSFVDFWLHFIPLQWKCMTDIGERSPQGKVWNRFYEMIPVVEISTPDFCYFLLEETFYSAYKELSFWSITQASTCNTNMFDGNSIHTSWIWLTDGSLLSHESVMERRNHITWFRRRSHICSWLRDHGGGNVKTWPQMSLQLFNWKVRR